MSWWSDGDPFDEYEGCKGCNFNKHPSKETCKDCKTGDKWNYKDWDEEILREQCRAFMGIVEQTERSGR